MQPKRTVVLMDTDSQMQPKRTEAIWDTGSLTAAEIYKARSLESLAEGYNMFLNQFFEIPRRLQYIIVCFLSLSANAGLNLPPFEISCS
jgi:hypothetical protein